MTGNAAHKTGREAPEHPLLIRYMFVSLAAAIATMLLKVLAAAITDSIRSGFSLMPWNPVSTPPARAWHTSPCAPRPDRRTPYTNSATAKPSTSPQRSKAPWCSSLLPPSCGCQYSVSWTGPRATRTSRSRSRTLHRRVRTQPRRRYHPRPSLVADGKHLLTDVWTSPASSSASRSSLSPAGRCSIPSSRYSWA